MSTRAKELLAVAAILVFSLVFYLGKSSGWEPTEFSTPVSLVVVAILLASLLWILALTIQGRLIGRRVVFLYVGIAVAMPLFMKLSQEMPVSPAVQGVYDEVMKLEPGSKVLIACDYDPPTAPELQPMAETFIRICFQRELKIIIMGIWPQGPQQANLALEKILAEPEIAAKNLQYGIDYVNLGFQAGNEFVIQRMGGSFKSMFRTDYGGVPYDDIPLVRNVKNFSNIDYCFNLSSGFPGTVEWVQIAVDRYGVNLGAGNTAVQAPTVYPYLSSGQLTGLLGGMSGAAEFERAADARGKGTKYMLSQSVSHLVVIAFVIIGNVAFIMSGRKSALKG
ncbi:MAG: radical SAM protein [Candidatus Zixiibacteriota bacterium]|nr:MAG: radical SAM protein [candidate division Zixibacteria bacterium]